MGLHRFDNKKELKKLDFKNNKAKYIKIGTICISFLVVIISIIYFTYSKFTLTDTFKTAESTVDTFVPADYLINNYVNGKLGVAPSSSEKENYVVGFSCNNGVSASWDYDNWGINISNATEAGNKCSVYYEKIEPDNSGASTPELYDGLIPVIYVGGNTAIADTNKSWYNYSNHQWANAVLIDQSNASIKNKYINADGTFKSGTIIDENDILQMYVWVPRYKYKLFNVSGSSISAKMIEVEFESANTAKSSGTQNNEWLTHPAFTFGTTELNGIWVGKFESSNSTSDVKIVPNVSSLRSQTIGSMFNASRAIETTAKYGLSSSEVDTHMMKNMEWGAVAYLTNSKYGRYESTGSCISSGCEVWINSNSNYTTGCAGSSVSAGSSSLCNQWNTSTGVNASTTGNIYGIYDMSGGAYEYVMGNMTDSSGNFYPASSGLSQPESKYYDLYTYGTSNSDYLRGHLGDATRETNNWNSDYTSFIASYAPWFVRGGLNTDQALGGIFHFHDLNGRAHDSYSFRITITKE